MDIYSCGHNLKKYIYLYIKCGDLPSVPFCCSRQLGILSVENSAHCTGPHESQDLA